MIQVCLPVFQSSIKNEMRIYDRSWHVSSLRYRTIDFHVAYETQWLFSSTDMKKYQYVGTWYIVMRRSSVSLGGDC